MLPSSSSSSSIFQSPSQVNKSTQKNSTNQISNKINHRSVFGSMSPNRLTYNNTNTNTIDINNDVMKSNSNTNNHHHYHHHSDIHTKFNVGDSNWSENRRPSMVLPSNSNTNTKFNIKPIKRSFIDDSNTSSSLQIDFFKNSNTINSTATSNITNTNTTNKNNATTNIVIDSNNKRGMTLGDVLNNNKKRNSNLSIQSNSYRRNKSLNNLPSHHTSGFNKESLNFINDNKNNNNNNNTKDNRKNGNSNSNSNSNGSSPRKLRRTSTFDLLDRFIPSRQTSSGKLTLEENVILPCTLPMDHIENETTKIYKDTVAEACGLEVGERILQFQPIPPESKNYSKSTGTSTNSGSSSNYRTQKTSKVKISMAAAQARIKRIPTAPEKVLDAPGIIDDFYLNLLSWSSDNILAIALENSVYCWNANTGDVDLASECTEMVTSVGWSDDGYYLSIGLNDGSIEIWDMETKQKLRTMRGHDSRISTHCWYQHNVSSGSRTGQIFNHDVRIPEHIVSKLNNHTAEVCGLKWRFDGLQLASGGNDNLVNIWDAKATSVPQFTKTSHTAAVKALAWCPTQTSILATGGGSACRKIHFWNTTTGARINTIETESQVSSLVWGYSNGIGKEIAACHGYPNNGISVYSYPSLQKTGVILDAHDSRILNSAISPDSTTLATVAADENLKFWKLFDLVNNDSNNRSTTDNMINSSNGKEIGKVMTIR
ncbi:hypothetical protein B5S33_g3320 [[Candida] boidinii]|nr:hypothetical protein B5S33_g3320 [[Candida] boidinii]